MAAIWRQQLQRSYKSSQWLRRYLNPTLVTTYHCGRSLRACEDFWKSSSTFAEIGWFVGALRMSYHDVQIRCALANFQSHPAPVDFSRSSMIPSAPSYHVELLYATAKLLHHRSLYSATNFASTMLGRQGRKLFGFSTSAALMNLRT